MFDCGMANGRREVRGRDTARWEEEEEEEDGKEDGL